MIQYTYNPLNQLTEFEDAEGNVTTYAYDGTGMRVSKTQGTNVQRFYWDRGYIVNESTNGTFTASNSIGTQGIFARTTGSGENAQTDFLFKNAHGDVTDVVSNDEVTNEYEYDAYGNQKNISANDTNPFRYCGEYYDEESGLIYLRNRYYDPEIERFITEDPAMDGMNWYAYCGNNPVIFVDPWGLKDQGVVYGYGNCNSDVALLQERLNELGYIGKDGLPLQIDGKYGDNTTYAVECYQRDNGLTVDGLVGDKTWNSIGFTFSNKMPYTGEPNSSNQLYNPDGSLKQERKYGVDGTPEYDDDYNHAGDGHGIGFPHRHTWENGERSKDAIFIPQINSSNSIDWKLMTVAGIATLIEVVTWSFGMPVDIPGN